MRVESGEEEAYTLNVTLSTTTRGDVSVTVVLTIYGHDKLGDEFQISKLEPYHFLPACSIEMIDTELEAGKNATKASSESEAAIVAKEAGEGMVRLQDKRAGIKLREALGVAARRARGLKRRVATPADFGPGGRFEQHTLGSGPPLTDQVTNLARRCRPPGAPARATARCSRRASSSKRRTRSTA